MNTDVSRPFWVEAAMSLVKTRRGGLMLVWSCVIFALYCLPWRLLVSGPTWLLDLLLAPDWSWFAIMVPLTAWYWLSLRWMDRNRAWQT